MALKVIEMTNSLKNVNEKVVKAKTYAKKSFSIKSMADSYLDCLTSWKNSTFWMV